MQKMLEIRVTTTRIPLSRASREALYNLARYHFIVFTSRNAKKFFIQEVKKWRLRLPRRSQLIQVGPRNDLLTFPIHSKRILFPRSNIAPYDIVRRLRARGAIVRVIPLYTTVAVPLSQNQKKSLLRGEVHTLRFKSPSGVQGLMSQLTKSEKQIVRTVSAECIGPTTASAARVAGFTHISISGVLYS